MSKSKQDHAVQEVPTEWRRILMEEGPDGEPRPAAVEAVGSEGSPTMRQSTPSPEGETPQEWQDILQDSAPMKDSISLHQNGTEFSERTVPGFSISGLFEDEPTKSEEMGIEGLQVGTVTQANDQQSASPEEDALAAFPFAQPPEEGSAASAVPTAPAQREPTTRTPLVVPEPQPVGHASLLEPPANPFSPKAPAPPSDFDDDQETILANALITKQDLDAELSLSPNDVQEKGIHPTSEQPEVEVYTDANEEQQVEATPPAASSESAQDYPSLEGFEEAPQEAVLHDFSQQELSAADLVESEDVAQLDDQAAVAHFHTPATDAPEAAAAHEPSDLTPFAAVQVDQFDSNAMLEQAFAQTIMPLEGTTTGATNAADMAQMLGMIEEEAPHKAELPPPSPSSIGLETVESQHEETPGFASLFTQPEEGEVSVAKVSQQALSHAEAQEQNIHTQEAHQQELQQKVEVVDASAEADIEAPLAMDALQEQFLTIQQQLTQQFLALQQQSLQQLEQIAAALHQQQQSLQQLDLLTHRLDQLQEQNQTLHEQNRDLEQRMQQFTEEFQQAQQEPASGALQKVYPLLQDLLQLYDFVELRFRTLWESYGEQHPMVREVSAIRDQLTSSLHRHGLEPLDTSELQYNPSLHRILQEVPAATQEEDGQITRIFRQGFRYQEQLFRPTEVEVMRFGHQ